MFKQERGSTIVLALVVTTVLSIMVAGSMSRTNNEVKMTTHNENRVKAGYLAEAGIKKVTKSLNTAISDGNLTVENVDSFQLTENGRLQSGSYNVVISQKVSHTNNLDRTYKLKATGTSKDGTENVLTAKVKVNNNLDDIFKKTVATGGQIRDKQRIDIKGKVVENANNDSDITIPTFDFTGFQNKADNNYTTTSFKTTYGLYDGEEDGEEDGSKVDVSLPGGITYVDVQSDDGDDDDDDDEGELEIDLGGGSISGPSPDNPAVLVVNGELEFEDINQLKNVYVIVKGEFEVETDDEDDNSSTGLTAKNTFIYAKGDDDDDGIEFEEIESIDYSGAIMTSRDVEFDEDPSGTIKHNKIRIDALYDGLDEQQGKLTDATIVFWGE